jgi:hypothetical protein
MLLHLCSAKKFVMLKKITLLSLITLTAINLFAQNNAIQVEPKKHWYESFSIRGYGQVRYNRLLETNANLKCEQCDKSWGSDGGFFIRRARLIISGNVSDRVFIYIQPDLANTVGTSTHFLQLRDLYFDLALDKKKEFRFRIGQSKIPFGYENLQSSQNRLPLDRNDALNSAVSNERDLGVFFYYASEEKRKLFASLVNDGLKGTGDYGIIGFGAYNGQTANKPDLNNRPHIVGRFTYPFKVKNQIIEPSIQAYTGNYVIAKDLRLSNVKVSKDFSYLDTRAAATLRVYPKPIGFTIEYNIGKGPEYNKVTDSIDTKNLKGGFAQLEYYVKYKNQLLIPFVRVQQYQGGKKHEPDARSYRVKELEIGAEWQPMKNFELVAMYTISKRQFEDKILKDNIQKGSLLRLQAQVNF